MSIKTKNKIGKPLGAIRSVKDKDDIVLKKRRNDEWLDLLELLLSTKILSDRTQCVVSLRITV